MKFVRVSMDVMYDEDSKYDTEELLWELTQEFQDGLTYSQVDAVVIGTRHTDLQLTEVNEQLEVGKRKKPKKPSPPTQVALEGDDDDEPTDNITDDII
jgi:hypothetical protein